MSKTLTLDDEHFAAAEERARELGTTTQEYIQKLIDHAVGGFDEISATIRKGFESMPDDELDGLLDRAQKWARSNP